MKNISEQYPQFSPLFENPDKEFEIKLKNNFLEILETGIFSSEEKLKFIDYCFYLIRNGKLIIESKSNLKNILWQLEQEVINELILANAPAREILDYLLKAKTHLPEKIEQPHKFNSIYTHPYHHFLDVNIEYYNSKIKIENIVGEEAENRSLRRRVLLLYELGIVDLLKEDYNLSKTNLAKAIALILDEYNDIRINSIFTDLPYLEKKIFEKDLNKKNIKELKDDLNKLSLEIKNIVT